MRTITRVLNAVPHCTTDETFRALSETASAVFNGKFIHPDAQKTRAN